MKLIHITLLALMSSQLAIAGDHTPENIIPLLKGVQISLLDGITLAEKSGAVATSAKFEISGSGKLALSVYTVPEGLKVEAENATLTELAGYASNTPFSFEEQVFTDKEHIARAAVHLVMRQLTKLSLKEVILVATAENKGVAIDIRNPMVSNGMPISDVVVVLPNGKATTVRVNLATGKILGKNFK